LTVCGVTLTLSVALLPPKNTPLMTAFPVVAVTLIVTWPEIVHVK
jgi:hypothetical protein